MRVIVRVALVGLEGEPVEAALGLEAYDLRQNAWRRIEDLLKGFRIAPRVTVEPGRYQAVFTLRDAAFLELFGTTAFFRLVTSPGRDGAAAPVVLADKRVASDAETLEVDFGTVLLLGESRGFATAPGPDGIVCAGVVLASDDAELAAAQRRFYARPFEIDEVAAQRDQARARVAELEAAGATGQKALADCQARATRLTRENAALTAKLETAASNLKACVAERKTLAGQLAAQTSRAAEAEAGLTRCGEERAALEARLAELNERLAGASADLMACAEARTGLEGEVAVATRTRESLTHQLEAAATELNRCREARGKAETDLAACAERVVALEARATEAADALKTSAAAALAAETQAAEAEQARVALNDRVLALEAELVLRAAELNDLRAGDHGEDADAGRLREKLAAAKAQAEVATAQLDALRTQTRQQVPTGKVFENLAMSLQGARTALAAANHPIRIGRADITLKTLVGGGGEFLCLADAANPGADPALSEVKVELIPDDTPQSPAEGELVVPDVLGLTETAVVRVLSSLFLRAEKAVETVVGQPDKHGRALRQVPKPGAAAVRGQTVLVVYGSETP